MDAALQDGVSIPSLDRRQNLVENSDIVVFSLDIMLDFYRGGSSV